MSFTSSRRVIISALVLALAVYASAGLLMSFADGNDDAVEVTAATNGSDHGPEAPAARATAARSESAPQDQASPGNVGKGKPDKGKSGDESAQDKGARAGQPTQGNAAPGNAAPTSAAPSNAAPSNIGKADAGQDKPGNAAGSAGKANAGNGNAAKAADRPAQGNADKGNAGNGNAGPSQTNAITVSFNGCTSVAVTASRHDLSNVVLRFADGVDQKFDGLSGKSGTFAGTGSNAGKNITDVWVKSAANHSGDGPGYGQHFPATACGSSTTTPDTPGTPGNPGTPGGPNKIGICHATGSATNPYVYIQVPEQALNGHDKHEGDIIGVSGPGDCPGAAQTTTKLGVCRVNDGGWMYTQVPEGAVLAGDITGVTGPADCPQAAGEVGTAPVAPPTAPAVVVTDPPVVVTDPPADDVETQTPENGTEVQDETGTQDDTGVEDSVDEQPAETVRDRTPVQTARGADRPAPRTVVQATPQLARTGLSLGLQASLAAVAMLLGMALVATSRRRTATSRAGSVR